MKHHSTKDLCFIGKNYGSVIGRCLKKNIFHFSDFFLDKIDFNLDRIDFNLDKIDFNVDNLQPTITPEI